MEAPICKRGYTTVQLARILGNRLGAFGRFMRGQTVGICQGEIDHAGCKEAHGIVTYPRDLEQFIRGGAPLD